MKDKKNLYLRNHLIRSFIIAITGCILWVAAIWYNQKIADAYGAVSIRYQSPVVTAQQMNNILEEMKENELSDIPEVTLWQKTYDTEVRNIDFNQSLNVDLVTVFGDMSDIYPGKMRKGSYPFPEDDNGCMIDSQTAYELFQTSDAVGLSVRVADKDYTIRGILELKNEKAVMVHRDASDRNTSDDVGFACMELKFKDSENAMALAKDFILYHDLGTPSAYCNGYLYQKIANRMIHLPGWLFAGWIMAVVIKKIYKLRRSFLLFTAGLAATVILGAVLIKIFDIGIDYPNTLIPNRWSDFDFWTKQWKTFIISLQDKRNLMQYNRDSTLNIYLFYIIAGSILAAVAEGYLLNACSKWKLSFREEET